MICIRIKHVREKQITPTTLNSSTSMKSIITSLSLVLTALLLTGCDTMDTSGQIESEVDNPQNSVAGVNMESDVYFLILDEDAIDNGDRYWRGNETKFSASTIRKFSDTDVNDGLSNLAQRKQLKYFSDNIGNTIWLWSGQVGDEGWHALKTIPGSWAEAGPTGDGLRNFLGNPSQPYPHNVGRGLGTGDSPEVRLDEIPDVTPLRAE
jgi:hypothetical protein